MAEIVNPKLMKKITEGKRNKNIQNFLIEAIREEFSHADQLRWSYTDFYKSIINKYALNKADE